MRRSMRLLSMAARAMLSICGDWQPAPAQRPVFCFAWMARRRLRVGRPRGDVRSHGRAFYGSLGNRGPARRGTSFLPSKFFGMQWRKRLVQFAYVPYIALTHPSKSTGGRDPATVRVRTVRRHFMQLTRSTKVLVVTAHARPPSKE